MSAKKANGKKTDGGEEGGSQKRCKSERVETHFCTGFAEPCEVGIVHVKIRAVVACKRDLIARGEPAKSVGVCDERPSEEPHDSTHRFDERLEPFDGFAPRSRVSTPDEDRFTEEEQLPQGDEGRKVDPSSCTGSGCCWRCCCCCRGGGSGTADKGG